MKSKGTFGIIIALSIAMVGATTATSISNSQYAFAATKNCEENKNCWCYAQESGPIICFQSKGDCQKSQRTNDSGSGCFKRDI